MLKIYIWSVISWIILFVLARFLRKKRAGKIIFKILYVILILFLIEGISLVGLYIKTGKWTFRREYNTNADLFEPHPYLVGVPKKSIQKEFNGITFTHNSDGFRGKEIPEKSNATRIIAIGGSTTYGVGVSDRQTWPYYLDSLLGKGYEVLNFGIPGHTTVENIILATFIIPEFEPDIVMILVGENDLRNMHVKNLESDYSDYHAPSLYGALGFCYHNKLPNIAFIKVMVLLLQKMDLYPVCNYHKMQLSMESDKADEYTLKLYKRNLKSLLAVLREHKVQPVLIPQILIEETLTGDEMKWWIPYVPEEDLVKYLNFYNNIMKEVAEERNVPYVKEALLHNWSKVDFIDACHLNFSGNLVFARILKKAISDIEKPDEIPVNDLSGKAVD